MTNDHRQGQAMTQSFVSLEQHRCPVCLAQHDTGNVLVTKSLSRKLNQRTVTGLGFCADCKQKHDDGFVALIALQREPNRGEDPLAVPRTGDVVHVRVAVWDKVFNVPPPAGGIAVCGADVVELLKSKMEQPA
jgi:hypothetical protein